MIYIYALRCPISGGIRYIGKTKNPKARLAAHLSKSRGFHVNHHCSRWIRKLLEQGLNPHLEVLHSVDGGDWQTVEAKFIADYRAAGHDLTNMTAGGDGFHDVHPEVLRKRGTSRSRSLQDPLKKAEFVALMSKARQRPEVRAAQSQSMRKAWGTPETRARMMSGACKPDVLKRRSETSRRINADPLFKEKQRAAMRIVCNTPEWKAAQSRRSSVLHADPQIKARHSAALVKAFSRPEVKKRLAAAMQEVNARPEVKGKRSQALKDRWGRGEFVFAEETRAKMSR